MVVALGGDVRCDDCSNEDERGDKGKDGYESESGNCNCMEKRPEYGYYSFVLR